MKSIADIKAIREKKRAEIIFDGKSNANQKTRIVVGMATCGLSAGAGPVYKAIVDELAAKQVKDVTVIGSGCLGMCKLEPIVEVFIPGKERITYIKVDADKAKEIIAKHIINGEVCNDYLINID